MPKKTFVHVVLSVLALNVALVYFTIAAGVVPRIQLGLARRRFRQLFRGGAVAFFVGCGFSHVHIAVHSFEQDTEPLHQIWMHLMQVVGGWAFVWVALRLLDIRVDPRRPEIVELQDAAIRDPLTGVLNRRGFEERTADLAAGGPDEVVGLLVIDIDDFKAVNDSAGHARGDDLLRRLATVLNEVVRPNDTVARIGGDEFVALLPGADASASASVAGRIVDRLQQERVAGDFELTVSVGTASRPEDAIDFLELLHVADDAMYASKRATRQAVAAEHRPHEQSARVGDHA